MDDYDPYHDDPKMNPQQFGDVSSPALNSPPAMSDSDARPTPTARHTFRSSVGLIPSPGSVSQRHPTYVR